MKILQAILILISTCSALIAQDDAPNLLSTITVYIPGSDLVPRFLNAHPRRPGMLKITTYPTSFNGRIVADYLTQTYPSDYNINRYYYYGWNGILSFDERKKAARDLLQKLLEIRKEYQKEIGLEPSFRIITYSHGGNVLLNMAKIASDDCPLKIEEVIMLACPVQERTKKFICKPIFKKIYAFYTACDIVQIGDPQGLYKKGKTEKLFSESSFPEQPNLRQARIKLNGRPLVHIEFFSPKFMKLIPELCKVADSLYDDSRAAKAKKRIINISGNEKNRKIYYTLS